MIEVIKRDGSKQEFDKDKIANCIAHAREEIDVEDDSLDITVSELVEECIVDNNIKEIRIEEIQDLVIEFLKQENKEVSDVYEEYRNQRTMIRDLKSDLMKTIDSIGITTDRDNANVGNDFSAKLLRIASESNKWHNLTVMPKKLSMAHLNGDIYHHDLDSYNLTVNCLHIPTKKLLNDGFNTGYGKISKPKSIISASELSCIMLQSSQNQCFGGQSHPNFDNDLSEYVEVERIKIREEMPCVVTDEYVEKLVVKRVHQAMQGVVYNLNTMHSRSGSQVPFSSLNIGIPKNKDSALICQCLLEEYEKGFKNGEPFIFPNIIFRVKEGVNREKGDPYYYLFELACRVASKRMNPTFMNIDADFNKKYYDEGIIPATMGCVQGDELVTYKYNDELYVESIKRMRDRVKLDLKSKDIQLINTENINLKIYDSKNGFVKIKNIIKNNDASNWVKITFKNGRVLLATSDHPLPVEGKGRTHVYDLKIGDKVKIINNQYTEDTNKLKKEKAWLLGFILCDGCYDSSITSSIALNYENDIEEYYKKAMFDVYGYKVETIERHRGVKGNYKDLVIKGSQIDLKNKLKTLFGGVQKKHRQIPNIIFNCDVETRKSFLAGMLDADGYIKPTTHGGSVVQLGSTNKELSLQTMALAQSIGFASKVYCNKYSSSKNTIRYRVEFVPNSDFVDNYIVCDKKKRKYIPRKNEIIIHEFAEVSKIEKLGYLNECSYDVETESDYFDVSGIHSHNCRTYVLSNINGESKPEGRGNIAPVTMNLPRLGIKCMNIKNKKERFDKFFELLNDTCELCREALLDRYSVLKKLKVKDLPFDCGQGLMVGSEGLSDNDSIEPVLKQGTWGIGFIGLAETLIALIGKHHGEDEEARELGYKIVSFIRQKTDEFKERDCLNYGTYFSPAEGLSGKFIKLDKKKYGIIKGVTDKDYYTNSIHIPVYYPISIKDKIDIEAPYHKLGNSGHISYVELDDYPTPETIMDIITYAYKNTNISYMGINFHIRYCKKCGTLLHGEDTCPKCGSKEIQGISRVTGYMSLDERFGEGKVAERKDRTSANGNKVYKNV